MRFLDYSRGEVISSGYTVKEPGIIFTTSTTGSLNDGEKNIYINGLKIFVDKTSVYTSDWSAQVTKSNQFLVTVGDNITADSNFVVLHMVFVPFK